MTVADLPWRTHERQPYRVLAVDDDPLQRMLLAEILAAPRYLVTVVDAGATALAMLAEQDFDVVLLDRDMPDIGGDDTCRRIRAELGLTLLPVLMVTGCGDAGDLADSLQAGATDFIHKPYLPGDLQARVDSAAMHKRTTRAGASGRMAR